MSTMPEDIHEATLAAERAAGAAEAAAEAAQRAAGAIESMGDWMVQAASRGAQPALAGATLAALEGVSGKAEKDGPGVIKRGVIAIGQRVSELSDGRYGLKIEPTQEEEKLSRRAKRRLARQEHRPGEEASSATSAKWFPWALGLSLGLVIGMVGVAYWQRRRLQRFWGQTSQHMQQATEGVRQRFEASRSVPPQAAPFEAAPGTPPGTPNFTSFGSSAPATDLNRQMNGRIESTSQ